MRTKWFRGALIALMAISTIHAQIGGGSLVGNVTDPSGAAVSSVKVKAIHISTNVVEQTTTNDSGYYEFPLLPAGRYRVEAEAAGFQKSASPEFSLNSGTRPRLDLTLTIGPLTENVQVTAQTPLVNATTTDLGVVVDRAKV
ncbi:MAG TPA: carboxypeptidase-like regulatory domain-containing protein, partial [Myxococcales bacterium]